MAAKTRRVRTMLREICGRCVGVFLSMGLLVGMPGPAVAAAPEIRTSPQNAVPACVTPPRLMAFLRSRNPAIDARFDLPGQIPVTLAIDRSARIVGREEGEGTRERFEELARQALGR